MCSTRGVFFSQFADKCECMPLKKIMSLTAGGKDFWFADSWFYEVYLTPCTVDCSGHEHLDSNGQDQEKVQ